MTTNTLDSASPPRSRDGLAAFFVETNFGVEPAPASLEQERASAVEPEERARAWRAVILGGLL